MITTQNRRPVLRKPESLTDEYELKGPDKLFITGVLKQARRAVGAREYIRKIAGVYSEWWPSLDGSLFFLGDVRIQNRSEVRRVHKEDPQRAFKDFNNAKEIMFVSGSQQLDPASALYIGRALAAEQINTVYYLGAADTLGDLREAAEKQKGLIITQDPLTVFRWQTPDGHIVRASSEMVEG